MGKARQRQNRLGEKLRQIRFTLNLTQSALRKRLRVPKEITYHRLSDYELNKLDPPLIVLLEYARVAHVHLEFIADDRLDLPKTIPGRVNYEGWKLPRPKERK